MSKVSPTNSTESKPFEPFSPAPIEVVTGAAPDPPASAERKQRKRRTPKPKDPVTGLPLVTEKDIKIDEYNSQKIRKKMQGLAPKATAVLEDILTPGTERNTTATNAQLLTAVALVFDRAGDKAAPGLPDKDDKPEEILIFTQSSMPQIPDAKKKN